MANNELDSYPFDMFNGDRYIDPDWSETGAMNPNQYTNGPSYRGMTGQAPIAAGAGALLSTVSFEF